MLSILAFEIMDFTGDTNLSIAVEGHYHQLPPLFPHATSCSCFPSPYLSPSTFSGHQEERGLALREIQWHEQIMHLLYLKHISFFLFDLFESPSHHVWSQLSHFWMQHCPNKTSPGLEHVFSPLTNYHTAITDCKQQAVGITPPNSARENSSQWTHANWQQTRKGQFKGVFLQDSRGVDNRNFFLWLFSVELR